MKRFRDFINEANDGLQQVRPGHWKHKNGSIHWENDRADKKGVGTYRVMRGDDLASKDPKKYRTLSAAKKALGEEISEAISPADKSSKGPFAIATKTRKGGLRRVPDTRFDTYDSAHKYGMQYHTDKYGSQMFHVVHHPDAKKRVDEMAVRDAAGKLIPIRKQTFRGADMKLHKAYPGKSSSSGGGGGGGGSGGGNGS